MKKMKIKDAVNYFDANYSLNEIDSHFSGSSLKPDFFVVAALFPAPDFESAFSKFLRNDFFSSSSFVACKRHIKFSFLTRFNDFPPLYFSIDCFSKSALRDNYVSSFLYSVEFNFNRYEELCNV